MSIWRRFSCYVIGEESVATQCAEVLLNRGHRLLGIISGNLQIKEWAEAHHIPYIDIHSNFESILTSKKYDYLFSIVNFQILPSKVLNSPRHFAINYHDALLPKYAGVHATSWAIINGERQHGITWHVMTETADAEDVLKQVAIAVDDKEIALSLNLKCYQAAINSFVELIDELSTKRHLFIPQNIKQRSYYGLHQKPVNNGWIKWNDSAENIERLCRALYFGDYTNRFSVPKFNLGNQIYIVIQVKILSKRSSDVPGTIVRVSKNGLQVATTTNDMVLEKICTIDGQPMAVLELCQRHNLKVGAHLKSPAQSVAKEYHRVSERLSQYESFWIKQLSNIKPTTLPFLPVASSRSAKTFKSIAIGSLKLPKKIRAQLKINASNFLLTLYLVYLYRINNQETISVVFAYPGLLSNKNQQAFFAEHVPLSLAFDDRMTFAQALKAVQQQRALLEKNGTYSKDIYVRHTKSIDNTNQPNLAVFIDDVPANAKRKFSFPVTAVIANDKLCLYANKNIINENLEVVLKNSMGHLQMLIDGVVENPKQSIAKLPLLTPAERQQMLVEWNRTETDYPRDKTVHQLFEEQVEKTPENIAVVFEDQQLTYRELNQRANQLAHYLIKQGIKTEDLVAICVERSLEMVVGVLGIIKAGGAYVPLDPSYPDARLEYMLQDTKAKVVLTQSHLCQKLLKLSSGKLIALDSDWLTIQEEPQNNLSSRVKSNNLIYVIYTSGSTGKPKGVLVKHGGVVNCLFAVAKLANISNRDVFLAVTSLTFDVAALDFYLPWSIGAKTVIANEAARKDGVYLIRILESQKISAMQATPGIWKVLLDFDWRGGASFKLLTAGEALSQQLALNLSQCGQLFNIYGPTEATIYSACTEIKNGEFVTIGKPISNLKAYVLDENLNSLPVGIAGELHLSGEGIAVGYLNQPKLTTEKFVTNLFQQDTKDNRLYKTGDLVRWLPNGNLEYIGRVDNQIKIRGFRVELGEIEHALAKYAQVTQTVVLLCEDGGHKNLVAYFTRKKSKKKNTVITTSVLQNFLRKTLPDYMVPSELFELAKFPLTANGKVDRNILLSIKPALTTNRMSYKEPITATERLLVKIWNDVFNLPAPVGAEDDFFSLGGDSIVAMRIAAKAAQLNLQILVKEIFEFPVIKDLAESVDARLEKVGVSNEKNKKGKNFVRSDSSEEISYDQLREQSFESSYPLSPMQNGLLFHAILEPTSEAYTVQLTYKVENLDVVKMCSACQILIDRHTILRTSFVWEGLEEPIQIVQKSAELSWTESDWVGMPQNQQKIKLRNFLVADRRIGFDFHKAPLMRGAFIKLSKTANQVILTFHHILLDGWSLPILLNELQKIYFSLLQGTALHLLPPVPYVNYIEWLQKQKTSTQSFWIRYLKGFTEPTNIPIVDKNKVLERKTGVQQARLIKLSSVLTNQVEEFCRFNQVTLSTLFQGLWGLLLNHYSQLGDIVFGVTVARRPAELRQIDQIVGPCINTLPLRINFEEALSVKKYLRGLQNNFLEVQHYGDVSLVKIGGWSDISKGFPLFNSILVVENYPDNSVLANPFVKFGNLEVIDPTHYPLTVIVIPGEALIVKVWYDSEIISTDAVERLQGHLQILLNEMIASPEKLIHKLNILTPAESQQMLVEWNRTKTDYPRDKTVHQLFEEQVEKTPENIAVVFEDQQLTYRELNQRANQLAHYLIKQGTKAEDLIAICVERSLEMVVGVLGIIKAGGAYVPLDPSYPDARLEYMLQDTKAKIVLTQSHLCQKLLKLSSSKLIALDSDWLTIQEEPKSNLSSRVKSSNLIYVIYTSGSMGVPKGVMSPHRTIVNLVAWQKNNTLSEINKIAQFASINFDVSAQEIFFALLNGIELHVVPSITKRSPMELISFILDKKIEQLFLPTAFLEVFAKEALARNLLLEELRTIVVAGEALKITKTTRDFFAQQRNIKLINHYGPSEAHVVSSYTLNGNSAEWPANVPIGKPISNVKLYILDNELKPIPILVSGELCIGGVSLAKGYLNQPQLSQEKFIPNPFVKNEYVYRTGDLVRYLPDGNLEYLGRVDDQVKIRGFRVEPGEIEIQLQKHVAIQKAVVVVQTNKMNKVLVAYITTKRQENIDPRELQNFLKRFLPNYMIPVAFVFMDKFPLTVNGKIDKNNLPLPKQNQLAAQRDYIAPRTVVEKRLVAMWVAALGVDQISMLDSFFELGGHSLSALQVFSKIRAYFGIDLSIRTLFDAPTVAELAKIIEARLYKNVTSKTAVLRKKQSGISPCLVPLQPHGHKIPLFLVHPVGGAVFWYVSLAKYFDPERPLYGIQDPGIEAKEIPFSNVEEMASFYIRAIRTIQPHGPYFLGGASAGATTSIEMARQLKLHGEKVLFVALLDGWVSYPEELSDQKNFEIEMRRQYKKMEKQFIDRGIGQAENLLNMQWQRAMQNAKYKINDIDQRVVLFKAMNAMSFFKSVSAPFNHWEKHTIEPIELYLVPGDHETMFQEPNVSILAEKLNECLMKVEVEKSEIASEEAA